MNGSIWMRARCCSQPPSLSNTFHSPCSPISNVRPPGICSCRLKVELLGENPPSSGCRACAGHGIQYLLPFYVHIFNCTCVHMQTYICTPGNWDTCLQCPDLVPAGNPYSERCRIYVNGENQYRDVAQILQCYTFSAALLSGSRKLCFRNTGRI